ncbi:MAG: fluoride efflux transporter CrcB [Bergeyella sp.]|nr:fluoride efflux transporter CrcB [Bergeyella sp.]
MIKYFSLIFLGGGFGSVFRALVSYHSQKMWSYKSFPFGTFLVNILGCFLIGYFLQFFSKNTDWARPLLLIGFCGGFTTFSTFSVESWVLWKSGNYFIMCLYVLLSLLFGFVLLLLGTQLAKT